MSIDLSAVIVYDDSRENRGLVQKLDLKNTKLSSSGMEVNFSCFGAEHSHGDETPSAYINIETTAWFCHTCKRRGNAISLVMEVWQIDRPQAERFLRDTYGIEFFDPVGGSMVAETEARFRERVPEPDPVPMPRAWLSSSRLDWTSSYIEPFQQYILDRGFSPEALQSWDIGYDYLSDRLTIPVFDIDGEPFGVKGRGYREDQKPKYLVLGDKRTDLVPRYGFNPYNPSDVVFGLHRNRDCKHAVLFEGEFNAIAASQAGVERAIATGMSYFTERHAQLIARECDSATVFYDYGPAGHDGVWGRKNSAGEWMPGAAQLLENYVRVRVVNPTPEDPADLLKMGRGDLILEMIGMAPSALLASSTISV